jgi:uroporphyrinogen-III synthase
MRDRQYTILSTANLPFERIGHIPETIEIRVMPFTEIIARSDENLFSRIKKLSQHNLNAVFTSANAVKIVAGILQEKPGWKVYCIRNETRNAVKNWLGEDSIIRTAENASALSDLLIVDKVNNVNFFCGDQRLNTLPDRLKENNIRVKEWIVYDTLFKPEQISYQPDAVLFFSPTAVKSFFSSNRLQAGSKVFAMGKSTAAALQTFFAGPVIISPEPDKALVVHMAITNATSHPIL